MSLPAPKRIEHMARKRYYSGTVLTVVIPVNGRNRRFSFTPRTGGGSEYITADETVQAALEASPKYGRKYRMAVMGGTQPAKAGAVAPESSVKRVDVACFDDAKDYLFKQFQCPLTKMRSKAGVIKYAKANGVEFYIDGVALDNTGENEQ